MAAQYMIFEFLIMDNLKHLYFLKPTKIYVMWLKLIYSIYADNESTASLEKQA